MSDIEYIIKEKRSIFSLQKYIEDYIQNVPEYYDYSWNIDDELLDENGFLITKEYRGIIEMDCPAVYIYIKRNIIQINFETSWENYIAKDAYREKIDKIIREALSEFSGEVAIIVPTSQGEDYPKNDLIASKTPLYLESFNSIGDILTFLNSNEVRKCEPNNGLDCYCIVENKVAD